jgi:hypothetical protein
MATKPKRDIAEDVIFGPYTPPDCGMHLYRYVKFHFVLFSILLMVLSHLVFNLKRTLHKLIGQFRKSGS